MKKLLFGLLFLTALGIQSNLFAAKTEADSEIQDAQDAKYDSSPDVSAEEELKAEKNADSNPTKTRLLSIKLSKDGKTLVDRDARNIGCGCESQVRKIDCQKMCVRKVGAPWSGAVAPYKKGFLCLCASSGKLGGDNVYINCDSYIPARCYKNPITRSGPGKWTGEVIIGNETIVQNEEFKKQSPSRRDK